MNNETLSHDGCIDLFGAIIAQAIRDYQMSTNNKNPRVVETLKNTKKEAEDFLFNDNRLERFCKAYGQEENLNCEYIRNQIKPLTH